MSAERLAIAVDDATEVSGLLDRARDCLPGVTPGLVLAHGANNDLTHPLLAHVALELSEAGVASVLRFNFPYADRGVGSPDPASRLEETYRRAHDALADDPPCRPGPMFLGGKSLGARIAAELVSRHHEGEGLLAAGLVFLGYPLHAPGKTDRLRLEPLRRIDVPSLFLTGTRDPLCRLDLLESVVAGLEVPGTLYVIEGGDHSLVPPRSSGRTEDEIYAEIARVVADFVYENSPAR